MFIHRLARRRPDVIAARLSALPFSIWLLHASCSPTWAWNPDPSIGTPIDDSSGDQVGVELAPDGSGGAYFVWESSIWQGSKASEYVYIVRVHGDGTFAWAKTFLGGPSGQYSPQIAPDGTGGAIVAWVQDSTDVRAQRVDANGNRLWSFATGGISVASTLGGPHRVVADGEGGAVVAWSDLRGGIYAQRLSDAGARLWQPAGDSTGVPASPPNLVTGPFTLVPDATGGAILAWTDTRSGNQDIYAQRLDADGQPLWTAGGIAVFTGSVNQNTPRALADGAGGAYLTYESPVIGNLPSPLERVQRIDADGSKLWSGVWLTQSLYLEFHRIVPDESGGIIVLWRSYEGGSLTLRAQRLTAQGQRLWNYWNGVTVSERVHQSNPEAVPDGSGGVIAVWEEGLGFDGDLYGQRVDASGDALWGPADMPISLAYDDERGVRLVANTRGSAIVGWNLHGNIYGQRVNYDGSLGVSTSIAPRQDPVALSLQVQNPVRTTANVLCELPFATTVLLRFYDVRGRQQKHVFLGHQSKGRHQWRIDLDKLANGSYWVALDGTGLRATRPVLVTR